MTLGERERFLVVTGYNQCENFKLGERNLRYIRPILPNMVTVFEILSEDKLVFTVDGLRSLTERLTDKTFRYHAHAFHNKAVPELKTEENARLYMQSKRPKAQDPVYDPSKPLKLRYRVLQEYLTEYEKRRVEDGDSQEPENSSQAKTRDQS